MKRTSALLVGALLFPAALVAQQRAVGARVPAARSDALISRNEVRAWYAELEQIAARLQAVHARALRDAKLRAAQDSLSAMVQRGMERADPELPDFAARVRAMDGEARQARAEGDEGHLLDLMREADRIQARFFAARQQVIQQPQLARQIRSYERRLHGALVAVEPQLDQLLARSTELQARIQRAAELQQMMMEDRASAAQPNTP